MLLFSSNSSKMDAKLSPFLQKEFIKIQKRDKKLADKIQKKISLFESDPKHPSLRLHKLTGELDELWSISISRSIRMVYRVIDNDIAYFVKIGTHEEVYKK